VLIISTQKVYNRYDLIGMFCVNFYSVNFYLYCFCTFSCLNYQLCSQGPHNMYCWVFNTSVTTDHVLWSLLLRDAMDKRGLCHHAVSICVCLSVCLSHSWILSKRITILSKKNYPSSFSISNGMAIVTTDRHKASCGLSATAELLVRSHC